MSKNKFNNSASVFALYTQLSSMIYIFYLIFYLTFNLKRADKFASPLQNTMSFPCLASYDLFLNNINKIIHTQLTQIPTYTDTVFNLTKSTDNEP